MPNKKYLVTLLKTLEGTAILSDEMRNDIAKLVQVVHVEKGKILL